MHFAIAAEQGEDFDLALRPFHISNEIQAKLRQHRSAAYRGMIASLSATDLPLVIEAQAVSLNPIFIVSLPRFGSALIKNLAAHSRVVATDELAFVCRIAVELERSGGNGRHLATFCGIAKFFALKLQLRNRWIFLVSRS